MVLLRKTKRFGRIARDKKYKQSFGRMNLPDKLRAEKAFDDKFDALKRIKCLEARK